METPKGKVPVDLGSLDSLNNLDTARMALRWALERIHGLERLKVELDGNSRREAQHRERVEEDLKVLQRQMALKAEEYREKDLHYAKMEELISLRLAGQLDAAALAQRELSAERMEQSLRHQKDSLEKEFALRRENAERETRRLQDELTAQARALTQKSEEAFAQRRLELEKDHLAQEAQLREKEIRLRQQERSLSERQAKLEEFYSAQRAQLHHEIDGMRADLEAQMRFRVENAERLAAQQSEALDKAWAQEKAILLSQLQDWRKKAEAQLPRIADLESKLSDMKEARDQAWAAAERQNMRLTERERVWEREKAALLRERADAQARAQEHLPRVLELEGRLAAALEDSSKARKAEETLELKLSEREKVWEQEREALRRELSDWRRRCSEQEPKGLELERRLAEAEEKARVHESEQESEALRLMERERAFEREKQALKEELAQWQERVQAQVREGSAALQRQKEALEKEQAERLAALAADYGRAKHALERAHEEKLSAEALAARREEGRLKAALAERDALIEQLKSSLQERMTAGLQEGLKSHKEEEERRSALAREFSELIEAKEREEISRRSDLEAAFDAERKRLLASLQEREAEFRRAQALGQEREAEKVAFEKELAEKAAQWGQALEETRRLKEELKTRSLESDRVEAERAAASAREYAQAKETLEKACQDKIISQRQEWSRRVEALEQAAAQERQRAAKELKERESALADLRAQLEAARDALLGASQGAQTAAESLRTRLGEEFRQVLRRRDEEEASRRKSEGEAWRAERESLLGEIAKRDAEFERSQREMKALRDGLERYWVGERQRLLREAENAQALARHLQEKLEVARQSLLGAPLQAEAAYEELRRRLGEDHARSLKAREAELERARSEIERLARSAAEHERGAWDRIKNFLSGKRP